MNKKIKSVSPIEFFFVLEKGILNLNAHLSEINELDVFPAPDKDTGSNMMFVYASIKNKTKRLWKEGNATERYEAIAKAAQESGLGISGMLFGETIAALCNHVKDKTEITIDDFAVMYELAYKKILNVVKNPVDGTIISLVRVLSEESKNYQGPKDDLLQYLNYIVQVADREVKASTEKIKELKKLDVVDAGSKGFYYFVEGFAQALTEEGFLEKEVSFYNQKKSEIKINPYEDKFMWRTRNVARKSFVAIAETRKAGEIFLDTGATLVILCPPNEKLSSEVIAEAIEKIDSEEIVIFLNDTKLAASIRQLPDHPNKKVTVVTTKTMLNTYYMLKNRLWNVDLNIAQNNQNSSLRVYIVPEDFDFDGVMLKKGEYINVMKNKLVARADNIEAFKTSLREQFYDKKDNILGLYIALGKNINDKDRDFIMNNNIPVYNEVLDLGQEDSIADIYIDYRDESLGDIALATDQSQDIPEIYLEQLKIEVIHFPIKIEGEPLHIFSNEITKNRFWEMVLEEKKVTRNSIPSAYEFTVVYEKLFARGYKKIILVFVASGLSGAVETAEYAKSLMGDRAKDITIVDSKLISFGVSQQIKNAAMMLLKKKSEEEVLAMLEKAGKESKMLVVLNDLTFMNRGGRLTTTLSKIADLFELKPIMKIENGKVELLKKVSGHKNAMKFISDYVAKESKNQELEIVTAYGGTQEELAYSEKLRLYIETIKNVSLVDRIQVGPGLGAHAGPCYGVGIYPKIKI